MSAMSNYAYIYCECGRVGRYASLQDAEEDGWTCIHDKVFCPIHEDEALGYSEELDQCIEPEPNIYRCEYCDNQAETNTEGWIRVDFDFDYCPDHQQEGIEHRTWLLTQYEVSQCVHRMVAKICV